MDWPAVVQYGELCLGFALVVKLLTLRLHRVYKYFAAFLAADILGNLVWMIEKPLVGTPFQFDYRIAWILDNFALWVFTLLTVYALLDAILAHLPGILKLSRMVLNICFGGAILVALASGYSEFRAALDTHVLKGALAHLVAGGFVLDRVIASVAVLSLLCMLVFLLLFPVQMSRNMVSFFSGFVVYFSLRTALMFVVSVSWNGDPELIRIWSTCVATLTSAVFFYWLVFITKAGESVPSKLRMPAWERRDEHLAVARLEAMNASLLRAVRR